MLCGQGVVAIWNGITEEGRNDFYAWHLTEHMPERVGIPGFLRGRRYRACDGESRPEFFTLYEVVSFEVLVGQDYISRLNQPTEWTKRATSYFRDTSRGLGRVVHSVGLGSGGVIATLRFGISGSVDRTRAKLELAQWITSLTRQPMITGAHLIHADNEASAVKTAESKDRNDILMPPDWIILIEACDVSALAAPVREMKRWSLPQRLEVGRYFHEYTRLKTDWAAG